MARHRGTVYREIKRNQAPPCSVPHKHYLLTLVDRKTGFTIIGKLESQTVEATNRRAIAHKLNNRPRKRLGFRTPPECFLTA